jgi:hypothetical protein
MNAPDFDKLSDEEKEHFFHCPKCGDFVDKRELRDVIFHLTDHKPKPQIPRIIGNQCRCVFPVIRIALESFLIAVWQMIGPQSTGKAQMKTILMLIVGLMLAGCGSMDNHVRNHGVASTSRLALQDRGNGIAVDTICACP